MMPAAELTASDLVAAAQRWQGAARLFDYPSAAGELSAVIDGCAEMAEGAPAAIAAAGSALAEAAATLATAEDLAAEHTFLFARQAPAPPRESSYAILPATAQGTIMSDLGAFYRAFGFATRPALPPDHLCAELAFVGALLAKEAIARENGWREPARLTRAARRRFIREHLGGWLPKFVERLERHARSPFYPRAGAYALALLRDEA